MLRRLAPAVVLMALAAGCSSAPARTNSDEKEHVAATTTSSVEREPEASVQDFAAVVAEHHTDWDAKVATLTSDCRNPDLAAACGLGFMLVGGKAEVIRLALSARHNPDAPIYIGTPPPEIKTLLDETETAAEIVGQATDSLLKAPGCADPMSDPCLTESTLAESAIDTLSGKLDAWSVYT